MSDCEKNLGVVINGIKWATCNVDKLGSFATNPEDPGMFYQWNCIKAWPAIGDVIGWEDRGPFYGRIGDIWDKTNDPSPTGWRVPTLDEIQTLFDTDKVSNEWTTQNGVTGRKFTDKATGNFLFLPAAGYRNYEDGKLYGVGEYGHCWSSTGNAGSAHYLGFNAYDAHCHIYGRSRGFSVRAVVE